MSFEAFLERHRGQLLAYYLLDQWHPGSCPIDAPYPPAALEEEELEALKARLIDYMPRESMILDLWDSDCHFEADLGDDWFYGAAFGCSGDEDWLTDSLSEYLLQKTEEYAIDRGEPYDPAELQTMLEEAAHSFIQQWRNNLYKRCGIDSGTGKAK